MSYLVILLAIVLCFKVCIHKGVGSLIRRTSRLRDLRDVEVEPVGRHCENQTDCRVTDGRIIANELISRFVAIGLSELRDALDFQHPMNGEMIDER